MGTKDVFAQWKGRVAALSSRQFVKSLNCQEMKPLRIRILEQVLRLMAQAVLWRRRPIIVGITGSVGKSSAKEVVALALGARYHVRSNAKNYNNEIGIPLTVIGAESGGRSVGGWFKVFFVWLRSFFGSAYPEVLVLEMGVDRPGDMVYLNSFVKPQVAIVTNISSSHQEFFGSLEGIAREKGVLVEKVQEGGTVILNADDPLVCSMASRTAAAAVTFGFSREADLRAENAIYNYAGEEFDGISFKFSTEGAVLPVRLRAVLAMHQVYAALAALAAAQALKVNLVEAARSLENFRSPQGRMNLLKGVNGSLLIDDTYNSSPASAKAALRTLGELKAQRKIAVMGDMLELGEGSEKGHRELGLAAKEAKVDIFVAVGRRMTAALDELRRLGWQQERIVEFADPLSAGAYIRQELRKGDIVLVKGSQGMRMEKVSEKILAEGENAQELLCRQSESWKKAPFSAP